MSAPNAWFESVVEWRRWMGIWGGDARAWRGVMGGCSFEGWLGWIVLCCGWGKE